MVYTMILSQRKGAGNGSPATACIRAAYSAVRDAGSGNRWLTDSPRPGTAGEDVLLRAGKLDQANQRIQCRELFRGRPIPRKGRQAGGVRIVELREYDLHVQEFVVDDEVPIERLACMSGQRARLVFRIWLSAGRLKNEGGHGTEWRSPHRRVDDHAQLEGG